MDTLPVADVVCLIGTLTSLPVCVVLSVADIRTHTLPNPLVAVLALCGAATLPSVALVPYSALTRIIWAAGTLLVLAGFEMLYRRLRGRAGIGAGDVKVLGASALFLGPLVVAQLLIACTAAVLVAVVRRSQEPFAFGPYLLGALIAVLLYSLLLM